MYAQEHRYEWKKSLYVCPGTDMNERKGYMYDQEHRYE
jgi:hypothetical protein